jgi:hypothetical protein
VCVFVCVCVCVCVCVFISVLSSRKYFSFSLWLIPRSCDERRMKAAGCLWPRILQSVTYVSSSSGETFMVNNKLYILLMNIWKICTFLATCRTQ